MKTWVRHRNALLAAAVLAASGALGFAVVLKTAFYYADTDAVAHALVWLIGLGMAGGLVELGLRLMRAVQLSQELSALPKAPTEATLAGLRPELRSFLQARLERSPLPSAPAAFTPYLVGLLVMLGLLGTFLGLFDTLRGARDALTASGDIEALRAGLAHPMAGLTRSFGSSAAGVSCSALLGLGLVCVRRVEMATVVQAHAYAAGPLQHLSPYQRQHDALLALAEQGRALPAAAEALSGVGAQLSGLASEWQSAHVQSSREMREALQTAVQQASHELERAARTSADRLHGHVAPLIEGLVERTAREAQARFEALQAEMREEREARREAEQSLRSEARRGLTELLEAARSQLEAQQGQQQAQLAEQREHQQAQLAEQREQQQVQLAEQRELQQGQLALLRESAEGFAGTLRTQAETLVESLSVAHQRDAEQVERAERALSGLEQAASAVSEQLGAQKAQLEELLQQTGEQVGALTASASDGLAGTLTALREGAEGLSETFAAQVQRLEQAQAEGLRALQAELSQHAARSSEGLTQAGGTVNDAAALLQATSAELSAVAEMFAASVESQREAARAWLENLGELEGAIEQSGRDAAADALGDQLAATQEVFARQLQFQKELFEQLRELRPEDVGSAQGEQRASA